MASLIVKSYISDIPQAFAIIAISSGASAQEAAPHLPVDSWNPNATLALTGVSLLAQTAWNVGMFVPEDALSQASASYAASPWQTAALGIEALPNYLTNPIEAALMSAMQFTAFDMYYLSKAEGWNSTVSQTFYTAALKTSMYSTYAVYRDTRSISSDEAYRRSFTPISAAAMARGLVEPKNLFNPIVVYGSLGLAAATALPYLFTGGKTAV